MCFSKRKDAAKSADIERGKFVEQQRQFEMKKRELLEKESQLQSQQSELEMRIGQAKDQKVRILFARRKNFANNFELIAHCCDTYWMVLSHYCSKLLSMQGKRVKRSNKNSSQNCKHSRTATSN